MMKNFNEDKCTKKNYHRKERIKKMKKKMFGDIKVFLFKKMSRMKIGKKRKLEHGIITRPVLQQSRPRLVLKKFVPGQSWDRF